MQSLFVIHNVVLNKLLNDVAICEVLADVGEYEGLDSFVAPKSQHSVGSMETLNVNMWESVFRDDAWRTSTPISKQAGFAATHPGGALERPVILEVGIMPARLHGEYVEWSCRRAGWAVLVPNRFLTEASFHTGDTPSWTQGDVIGEGVHVATGKRMVLCNLGGYDTECQLNEESVRVADGPLVRAFGSEGGHGYGWWKRKHHFSPAPGSEHLSNGAVSGGSAGGLFGSTASAVGSGEGPGLTEHISKNIEAEGIPDQLGAYPIADYDAPSDIEGVDGTQDSTARVTFPKVSHGLPTYMLCTNASLHPDDGLDLGLDSADSSGEDWLPDFGDTIESSDSEFDVDNIDEDEPRAPGLERWCMSPESFAPVHMDTEQLAEYYRLESWNSSSVDFVRTRDNFTSHTRVEEPNFPRSSAATHSI